MKTEKISALIGLFVTLLVTYVTYGYLEYKNQIDSERVPNNFYGGIESLDLRYNDIKYKIKKPYQSNAKVALLAIDDDSLREIGRWPWDRDLMAELTEKTIELGAKSIGFDAIFSEPQKNALLADKKFGAVVEKYPDRIILGTFSEQNAIYQPYQDYCVAEAFAIAKGSDIVKLNPTFVVDDQSSAKLDDLDWGPLFQILFSNIKNQVEQEYLAEVKKGKIEDLTEFQKNYLDSAKTKSTFEYCQNWLTSNDPFMSKEIKEKIIPLYEQIYKNEKDFKDYSVDQFTSLLISQTLNHPIPEYGEWTPNIPELQAPSSYTASFIAKLDTDGYVRRYPMFFRSGNKLGSSFIPSLALQSYLLSNSYRAEVKVEKNKSSKKITGFTIFDTSKDPEVKVTELPVDQMGQMMVNYYGPQMSLPYISAKELFSDSPKMKIRTSDLSDKNVSHRIREETVDKKEFMKDRNILFGATAIGVYDLRNIPIEPNYPGPEIHLTMLANLLDNNFLKIWQKESLFLPLVILVIGIILSLGLAYTGSLQSLIALPFLFAIIVGADIFLFLKLNLIVSSFFVILLTSLVSFAIIIYKYFTEERKKRELKSTFSKYVSPAVVDELLKDAENLKLGGKRQRMTVFFSDVRGFTTISEKLTPEELSRVLNLYLTPMTEIVFKNNGTLDKYMGDAIMAFFGAPVLHPHHAREACRCALESIVKLKELQKEFAEQNLPNIDIGIGLNTGDMSVGNMGSNIVQNYTVMGDSVNLGSRLEGINKEYGTRIIISEFTYSDVKEEFSAREVDRVKVKGKNEPVRIFELIKEGPLEGSKKELVDHFNKGYELYHHNNFTEAKSYFEKALTFETDDKVSKLYIERCEDYIQEPPDQNWDGVFVMKTK